MRRDSRLPGKYAALPDFTYVRFNWHNLQVFVAEILEFLQLIALVFSLSEVSVSYSGTLSTSTND
jgi:hypothetical protein